MQITPKTGLTNFPLPLPIYESVHIADAVNRDGEEFKILAGLDKSLVEQLKKYSLDESDTELQKTKDKHRFGEKPYEEWYQKTRTPFALIHKKTGALAAAVWFGPKPLHEGCKCHSVGWRSYLPFRGTGIMKNFADFSINFYLQYIKTKYIWARIRPDNEGSIKLAKGLGFEKDENYSSLDFIIMTKKV